MTRGTVDRREQIVDLVRLRGDASVEDMAAGFGVSASTIRRDLAMLSGEGRLARTYGGVLAVSGHEETSLEQRLGEAHEQKRAIARWASRQVQADETLLLDGGTTVAALAHELAAREQITVVSVSLAVVSELAETDVDVLLLGGQLRRVSRSFVGPLTEASLERMTFDRAFLGADAVDAERGLCEADLAQTRLKELFSARAEETYVLAHSAKLGARPFHAWAQLPMPWTVVTDWCVTPEQRSAFARHSIRLVVVDESGRETAASA